MARLAPQSHWNTLRQCSARYIQARVSHRRAVVTASRVPCEINDAATAALAIALRQTEEELEAAVRQLVDSEQE